MKKGILVAGVVALVALSACDYETKATKQMRFERDSIQSVQQQQLSELEEYMDLIQKVNEGFDAIRTEQNYISVSSDIEGQPSADMEMRVADGFAMVNRLLEENRARIEELESKVKKSGIQSAKLQKTIAELTSQLDQKNIEISNLQYELEQRNYRIDSLLAVNSTMAAYNADLEMQSQEQADQLAEQDAQMHRAYYVMGTRRELRDKEIDAKRMKTIFRDQYFTSIDIREFNVLHIDSKTAKLLTKHPVGSYELERGDDRKYTLRITSPIEFWSVSKYLVIQLD